jgi:carboxyl-terminal processing protease
MKINKTFRLIGFIIIVIVILAIFGGTSFYGGYKLGVKNPEEVVVKGITNISDQDITADFGTFWQAWKILKNEHLKGEEAKDRDFVYGAISGMTNSLKDPNTIFLTPDDAKKFEQDIVGSFGGIGAEIGIRNEQLMIIAPLKDSPAEKARLRSGDKIAKIDDTLTAGLSINEAIKLIRGPEGTKVVLTILRDNWENPKEITIIRQIIQIPTLDWELIEDKISYIQLYSFNENAPPLFYEAAINVLYNDSPGIILDLRNNPGGFLEIATHLAGWFLERGDEIVTEKFRSKENKVFKAQGNEAFKNMPMVILVNQGSASASEILAGALRDNRGIKLVGEKTFGKGTVQELRGLKDDSVLKITIAQWLLPSGAIIEKNGLMPDYEVKMTDEDIEAKKDPQLDKAIEVLKQQISANQ